MWVKVHLGVHGQGIAQCKHTRKGQSAPKSFVSNKKNLYGQEADMRMVGLGLPATIRPSQYLEGSH